MTFPEIKLVDAPTAMANVLFDFNDTTATPARVVLDGFSLGAPQLEGDPDATDPLLTDRLIKIPLRFTGTKPQVAAATSLLSRRLLANGQGWLSVRLTSTSRLYFFRTYRAQPGDLSFELVQTVSASKTEQWELEVNLPAEPLAYGERQTQAVRTVNQDPTAATQYPTFIPLEPLIGDGPTPLRFQISSSSTFSGRSRLMVSHHASSLTVANPSRLNIGSGDGNTGSADVTVQSDAAYTGGSYRRVAFTSPPSNLTIAGQSLLPGRYKVLLRATVSDAATVVTITPGQSLDSGETLSAPPVRVSSTVGSGGTWVDLGEFSFPFRGPRESVDQPVNPTSRLQLGFVRNAGTGTLGLDHLVFVPVARADTQSSRTVFVESVNLWTIADRALVVDSDSTDAWGITPSSGAVLDSALGMSGAWPLGIPGAYNVAEVLFSTSATAPADTIARNLTVTVSYYPRFLYIGDL